MASPSTYVPAAGILRTGGKLAEAADHAADAGSVIVKQAEHLARPGRPFTKSGKKQVWSQNAARHGGTNLCENCGVEVAKPQKHRKGIRPPDHEGQVDHVTARAKGGSGTPDNGQILCRDCNLDKADK